MDLYQQLKNRKIGIIYCDAVFHQDVNDFVENVQSLLKIPDE